MLIISTSLVNGHGTVIDGWGSYDDSGLQPRAGSGVVHVVVQRLHKDSMTEIPRILIVDDDPLIQESLTLFLRLRGYIFDIAANGQEALASITKHRPDLVVLDLGLPDRDGREVCESVRQTS